MGELAIFGGEPFRKEPFHGWPIYGEEEEKYLLEVVRSSRWGVGKRTGIIGRFEKEFAQFHGAPYSVACTNCTQALEVMLIASGVGAGDEVIVPSYTFIATASSVARVGATPVFADVGPETLTLGPESIESLVSYRTKAIIPVHFAGHFADMEAIKTIADRHGLLILEDAAQAHGARWAGHSPGEYGPAAFSFQYSKNMTAGEGGIIIGHDEGFIERCWEIIWHGRKKGGLWYEHFETTSNFRITEWSAAVLLAQLGRLSEQNQRRMGNANYLSELLSRDGYFVPLKVDPRTEVHPRHLFLMKINREAFGGAPKDKIVEALSAEGLPMVGGYQFPLYDNPAFRDGTWGIRGVQQGSPCLPQYALNAEVACKDVLWIVHNVLLGTRKDMEDIAGGARKVGEHANACYVKTA